MGWAEWEGLREDSWGALCLALCGFPSEGTFTRRGQEPCLTLCPGNKGLGFMFLVA